MDETETSAAHQDQHRQLYNELERAARGAVNAARVAGNMMTNE
jgi:hypothetical protein